MSALQRIRNQIAGARRKVAHAASVVEKAERRVDYWTDRRRKHEKSSDGYARCDRKVHYWTGVLKRAYQARHDWRVVLDRRIAKKRRYLKRHHEDVDGHEGLVVMDGRQVPRWIAEILQRARNAGTWRGSVISGYRTPEYSEQLCRNMCGAPSCPGRCGGRASNHACPPDGRPVPYHGACDVTDAAGLRAYCRAHGEPLHGGGEVLSRDIPHFSSSGR